MYTTENQSLNLRYTYKKIIIVAAVFDRRDNVRDGKIPKAYKNRTDFKLQQSLQCWNARTNLWIVDLPSYNN